MNNNEKHLILLTSPPASGKTYWISSFKSELQSTKILVVSPLRALANECLEKWGDTISVVTPEEWVGNKILSDVVIIDEFHLFFYWGDTFRPIMWEVFYELSLSAKLLILLTATLSVEMKNEISLYSSHFDSVNWYDFGNRKLKNKPIRYLKAPNKYWMMKLIQKKVNSNGVSLIFCEFRQEVLDLEKQLKNHGFNCLSCIGGESKFMAEKLKNNPHPDFIISTTVLSHGVNLPKITKIYFMYKVSNIDFWIQMVARGGRKGETYSVYALENPYGEDFSWVKNFLKIKLEDLKLFFSSSFLFP